MSVGSALAQAREAAGESLDEVSAATRIRPHVLDLLEHDDVAGLGGPVYARGHVRAVAEHLGIDPAPLLAGLPAPATGPQVGAPLPPPAAVRPRRAVPGWLRTAGALVLVLVGVAGTVAVLRAVLPDRGHRTAVAAQPSASAAAPPSAAASVKAGSRSGAAGKPAHRRGLTLKVVADDGRSWVGADYSDGRAALATVVEQGQSLTVKDPRKLAVTIGSLNSVRLTLNGHPYQPADHTGVVRFTLRAPSAR